MKSADKATNTDNDFAQCESGTTVIHCAAVLTHEGSLRWCRTAFAVVSLIHGFFQVRQKSAHIACSVDNDQHGHDSECQK